MKPNVYTLLAEKYSLIQENPLETEINDDGTHKGDHNVEMARTKALQAAQVAPKLHEILEMMDENAPLKAWMVTHVTQAADMLQDVLAKLEEEKNSGEEFEPVKDESSYEPEGGEEEEGYGLSSGGGTVTGMGGVEGQR